MLSRALRRGAFSCEPTRPCPFLRSLPVDAVEAHFFLEASQARQTPPEPAGLPAAERAAREAQPARLWQSCVAAALRRARDAQHAPHVERFLAPRGAAPTAAPGAAPTAAPGAAAAAPPPPRAAQGRRPPGGAPPSGGFCTASQLLENCGGAAASTGNPRQQPPSKRAGAAAFTKASAGSGAPCGGKRRAVGGPLGEQNSTRL